MSVFGKAGSTKGKILIIDDEEDVREVIKLHLDSDKYDLIEASNGEDAIKVMKEGSNLLQGSLSHQSYLLVSAGKSPLKGKVIARYHRPLTGA
mgnify:CR=1 FL=1